MSSVAVETPAGLGVGPSTTPQHAVDGLRRALVAGVLRPGERVAQTQVALQLGVSVAPVREALRMLEQVGQVTYRPRRGYFVTELRIEDLEEIYALRTVLEERAARHALPGLDETRLELIRAAASDCAVAAETGDLMAELEANRRFHFAILDSPDRPQTMRVIRHLWDTTEVYRALYYNSPDERRNSVAAHGRILRRLRKRDAEGLVAELDKHRERALQVLRTILAG